MRPGHAALVAAIVVGALGACSVTAVHFTPIDAAGSDPTCPGAASCPAQCGNGVEEPGEQCDDGNRSNGDGCEDDCTLPRCGNRIVDLGEQCDDGELNGSPADTCDITCHEVIRLCGNDMVDPGTGEECDPGPIDSATCNSNMAGAVSCKAARCGDGYPNLAAGENCDSGAVDTM